MYLHIGNDKIIKKDDIIAILDYEKLKKEKEFQKFFESIEKNIEIIDKKVQKTLILTKKDEKIKGFITSISSTTLAKRGNTKE